MKTEVLSTTSSNALEKAYQVLLAGGLVAFPTDTVYGLGALVSSATAIKRIYDVKGRDFVKAIPVLAASLSQLRNVAQAFPEPANRLATMFWPGALTLVVKRRPELPSILSSTPTVAVRMPDHVWTLSLLALSGPLAVTSANLSGGENPLSAVDVCSQLDGRIDLVLDGGLVDGGIPSTIVDCSSSDLSILRHGAISDEEIWSALK